MDQQSRIEAVLGSHPSKILAMQKRQVFEIKPDALDAITESAHHLFFLDIPRLKVRRKGSGDLQRDS